MMGVNFNSYSLLLYVVIVILSCTITEARPSWDVQLAEDAYELPVELQQEPNQLQSPVSGIHEPKLSQLSSLRDIFSRLTQGTHKIDRTHGVISLLEQLLRQLKNHDARTRGLTAQKRSPMNSDQFAVLPPWQEFCLMLRMGNCWRYKRSAPQ